MSGEKSCPNCGAANPIDNRYCGQCGSGLRFHAPEENRPALIDESGRLLPEMDTKQVARSLAVGVAALTAELAIVYLRRRLRAEQDKELETVRVVDQPERSSTARRLRNTGAGLLSGAILIMTDRQLTQVENGRPVRQIIERTFYRRER